jgi:hypothetical protein
MGASILASPRSFPEPNQKEATVVSDETEAAYRAGSKVLAADFSSIEDPEKASPGVHLNPFGDDRPEERDAWLNGLKDALEGKTSYDPATIIKEINDELKVSSHAR